MSFVEILLLAIGLSMDSLAVSVTSGILIQSLRWKDIVRIAFVLGLFQAGFTVMGFFLGMSFQKYIVSFDHWIAFALLLYLGGKMIYECYNERGEDEGCDNPLKLRTLCGLGVATSIDALAVGVSFACLSSSIAKEAIIIGLVTFLISSVGTYVGHKYGRKINLKFELLGGIILIGIGIKILIEHLFFNA
jgi:putative Mn2+ efflux pump MntP